MGHRVRRSASWTPPSLAHAHFADRHSLSRSHWPISHTGTLTFATIWEILKYDVLVFMLRGVRPLAELTVFRQVWFAHLPSSSCSARCAPACDWRSAARLNLAVPQQSLRVWSTPRFGP